jgi:hypothetical protein
VSVQVFVEGGGNQARTRTACRKAFHTFFEKLLGDLPKPRIIPCGSRNDAYGDFCRSISTDQDITAILLVDSECALVEGRTAVNHLRISDKWASPLPEGQVHLMVQCMEAWFLADRPTLLSFYGDRFKGAALPRNPNIEAIAKQDVIAGLERRRQILKKAGIRKRGMDSRSWSFWTQTRSKDGRLVLRRCLLPCANTSAGADKLPPEPTLFPRAKPDGPADLGYRRAIHRIEIPRCADFGQ